MIGQPHTRKSTGCSGRRSSGRIGARSTARRATSRWKCSIIAQVAGELVTIITSNERASKESSRPRRSPVTSAAPRSARTWLRVPGRPRAARDQALRGAPECVEGSLLSCSRARAAIAQIAARSIRAPPAWLPMPPLAAPDRSTRRRTSRCSVAAAPRRAAAACWSPRWVPCRARPPRRRATGARL